MKNIALIIAISIFGLLLNFSRINAGEKAGSSKENPVIIDNRTLEEYNAGHINGAILIPFDQINDKIAKEVPDKKAHIALYCRSGRRSGIALSKLKELGYVNAENYGAMSQAKEKLKK